MPGSVEERRGVAYYAARVHAATHRDLLTAVEGLSDARLTERPGNTNSIAFDLWHLGRWADHLGSILSEMTPALRERFGVLPEIWTAEHLVDTWRLPVGRLGLVDTGMTMRTSRRRFASRPRMCFLTTCDDRSPMRSVSSQTCATTTFSSPRRSRRCGSRG